MRHIAQLALPPNTIRINHNHRDTLFFINPSGCIIMIVYTSVGVLFLARENVIVHMRRVRANKVADPDPGFLFGSESGLT